MIAQRKPDFHEPYTSRPCPHCNGTGKVFVFETDPSFAPVYRKRIWNIETDKPKTHKCGMCGGDGRIDPWDEYDGKGHRDFDDYYDKVCDRYEKYCDRRKV